MRLPMSLPPFNAPPEAATGLSLPCSTSRRRALLQMAGALCASAAVPASAAGPSPTLAKLRAGGVIALGYQAAIPPFSAVDGQLRPVGFSVDLCLRVVDALRRLPGLGALEVRWTPLTSTTRLPMVANGSVDIECGATTNTPERARRVGFSLTFFVAEIRLLTRPGRAVQRIEDLRGRTVVSMLGTTSIARLQQLNREADLDLRIVGGYDTVESLRILQSGRAEVFALDDVVLKGLLATQPGVENLVFSPLSLSVEPYALVLPPGDAAFKAEVDAVIRQQMASGEWQALYRRWFLEPAPPAGVSLNLSLSPAMQRLLQRPTDSPDPAAYR